MQDQLSSVEIAFNVSRTEWTAALARVMADPVGALMKRDSIGLATAGALADHDHEIQVCKVKSDATFYSGASVTHEVFHTVSGECEVEVLVQEENGWTCAVLSGIRLGWAKNGEILHVEHDVTRSADSGRGIILSFPEAVVHRVVRRFFGS